MIVILASSNKGKIKEIQELLPQYEVIPYSKILGSFEIVEDGDSFQQNAIIKTKAVVEALKNINFNKEYIVISDDSGITVPELNNEPNIYSARYAGDNATDKQNNDKLLSKLKEKSIVKTTAYYTAALAIYYKENTYTTHGWMYGDVIDEARGEGGFGYDPLFIPKGYKETLGELPREIKKDLSHRTKALKLAMILIDSITKDGK